MIAHAPPPRYSNVRVATEHGVVYRGTRYDAPRLAEHAGRPVRVVPVAGGHTAVVIDMRGNEICQALAQPSRASA